VTALTLPRSDKQGNDIDVILAARFGFQNIWGGVTEALDDRNKKVSASCLSQVLAAQPNQ